MYPVEVPVVDEGKLAEILQSMRTWLDHKRFEPMTFRYALGGPVLLFRVEFAVEAEAFAFAKAFGGTVLAAAG